MIHTNPLCTLPKIDKLADDLDIRQYFDQLPRAVVMTTLRETVAMYRENITRCNISVDGTIFMQIKTSVIQRLQALSADRFTRVINATGVVLHTNLGRAPLMKTALQHINNIASGYCTLEYNAATGKRRDRNGYTENLLKDLTGAEAALTVNNNAAAVLLCLNTLCAEREVIVSRGEIVEIGDSFRIMEIAESGGCIVREAGATNRTRSEDYEKLINGMTGVLLKVHRSNFKIVGYTGETGIEALTAIRDKYVAQGIAVVEDMGSGLLGKPRLKTTSNREPHFNGTLHVLDNERTVSDAIREGADVVTFSGDKLLGGPQAGIIVGKRTLIERMKRNPLYRCLRLDKLCLGALEATLRLYARGLCDELPVMRMLLEPAEQVRERALLLCDAISGVNGLHADVFPHDATPGGGAFPGETIDSFAVRITADGYTANEIDRYLRSGETPVIATVQSDTVLLDMRTVYTEDISYLAEVLRHIFSNASNA